MKKISYVQLIAGMFILVMAACHTDPADNLSIHAKYFSDVEGINIQVGHPAPDFSLPDSDGNTVRLTDYRGKKNVMLVFYRGSWCPFCVSHLEDIQNLFPTLDQYDIQLFAISPEVKEESAQFAKKFKHPYHFLSDTTLKVVDQYGIRRDEELPHPAVILIDRNGIIKWFYASENYQVRPSASQLQQVIERLL